MNKVVHRLKASVVGVALASTLVGVGGVVVVGTAIAASQTMVTTTTVNMRSGPGSTYAVVDVVDSGARVTATGSPVTGPSASNSTWTPVTYNGQSGYIATVYLSVADAADPGGTASGSAADAVTNTDVNIRSGPGTTYSIVAVATQGAKVQTTGVTSDTWTQVLWSGTARWISSKYLQPVAAGSTQLASSVGARVAQYALAHVGYPYEVGTKGPSTFDCAGLVVAAYASADVKVPFSLAQQSKLGTPVARADLRPGDVILWGSPVSAISIYVGDDQLVIADGYGYGVRKMSVTYRTSWATFAGGRRYVS